MNYQEFLMYLKENLPELMMFKETCEKEEAEGVDLKEKEEKEVYEADLHQITKNNGIVLDGITLRKKGEMAAPTIYLNSYFESYQMGKPIAAIMEEIIYRYQRAKAETMVDVANVRDFKAVKERIVLRLVNYDKNKEQLKNCPYKRYLDLAITFRLLASKDAMGMASSLVSNTEFEIWNIGLEELYQIALFNTMREFPWQMDSLANVVIDCLKNRLPENVTAEMEEELQVLEQTKNGVNMYVLTNDAGLNGATCILYDNVIKKFAKVQDCNIYILPSSIHEVMLVPENEETESDFLENLVLEANQSAVGLIDLLSDHIYYYDRDKEQIYIYGQN